MQTIPAFYFDPRELAPIAARAGEAYRTARPFRHVVLDDFLPAETVALLMREFPGPADIYWEIHGPGRTAWERDKDGAKLSSSDETKFGPFTRHFMGQLNSATFLAFLEELTGVRGILPDVSYGHCGMHSTGRGGRLMMHTDVNRHPHGLHQFLNLILYLNEDWREEYGGHLELWDEARQPVQRILPVANRVVLFHTGTRSLHGHPHPLTCPPERRRNSLAVYYYLRERPADEEYTSQQKTVHWLALTEEDRAFGRERTAQALARLGALSGRSVEVPLDLIPFESPAGLLAPGARSVMLRFLVPAELADRASFAATHLRAALAAHGEGPADFFARFRPIALVGEATLGRAGAITCLIDGEGEVFVVRGPESAELLWVGYLDEILASLVGS